MFLRVEVKFFYTFNFSILPLSIRVPSYLKSFYVRSASCLFRSSASLVQMSFLILISLRWLIYVITCFSSTLYFEQKLLMESPSFTLTECSSCKSFKHFLGRNSSGVLPVDSVWKTSMKCPRLFWSGTGCRIPSVFGPTHLLLEHQEQRLEVSSLQACTTTEFH